jgi:hypothetical protein
VSETRPLKFASVEEAELVLRPYLIKDRLAAMRALGFDLYAYTRQEIADFIGASRERVTREMLRARRDANEAKADGGCVGGVE